MIITNAKYNICLEFDENNVAELVIESPAIYAELIMELLNQRNGLDGGFIISSGEKEYDMTKAVEIIMNPFEVDLNNKRVIQKLYTELSQNATELLTEDTYGIQGQLVEYLDKLIQSVPYPLTYDINPNVTGLLKVYNMKIAQDECSFLGKLIEYMKIMHQVCRIEVFLFVNLHMYLTKNEFEQLYEFSFYEKVHIILFENVLKEKLPCENIVIIDQDQCLIDLSNS